MVVAHTLLIEYRVPLAGADDDAEWGWEDSSTGEGDVELSTQTVPKPSVEDDLQFALTPMSSMPRPMTAPTSTPVTKSSPAMKKPIARVASTGSSSSPSWGAGESMLACCGILSFQTH